MTTIAALQCVERGLFSLDSPDDVAHLLPEYSGPEIVTGLDEYGKSMMKPATKRMTLRHLLTQSSGLGFSISSPSIQAWSAEHGKEMFPADIADGLRLPLLFEPGEGFEYGVGLDWVGKMVERANNGIGLEEYMRGQIWSPLGMGKTTFHLEQREDVARDLVEMTSRSSSDGTLTKAVSHMPTPVKEASGGGGAYTTPKDFVNILSSLLRDDGRLLRSESIEEMFRPQLSSTIIDAWMAKESGIVRWKDASRIHTGKEDSKLNWGLGSMLILEDLDNGLRKGTLTWGGSPNMFWVSFICSYVEYYRLGGRNSGSIVTQGSAGYTPAKLCPREMLNHRRCLGSSRRTYTSKSQRLRINDSCNCAYYRDVENKRSQLR